MAGEAEELDLRRYLRALRRRKYLILAVLAAMVALVLVLSFLQPTVYQGRARVVVEPAGSEAVFDSAATASQDPTLTIDTEIEIIESPPLRTAVIEKLGPVPEVQADRVDETLIIEIRGRSNEPARAAEVTNVYTSTYLELRRQQAAADLLSAADEIRSKIVELQSQLDTLAASSPDREDVSAGRLAVLGEQQARLEERLEELEVQAALTSGGVELVNEASLPSSPDQPKPLRNGLLAVVAGLIAGLGLACLLEYLDDAIHTREDLARTVVDLPLLGVIPTLVGRRTSSRPSTLVASSEPDSPSAEAYRALRTSVQLLGVERPLRTLQITSPAMGEGKTTTVANLAIVLVRSGQRVVLVDCDLRRPALHELFGLPNDSGVTTVLAGDVELADALQPVPNHPNLAFLASGAIPPNPSELLGSTPTSSLLFELQTNFDVVLVDSPPVLPVTDATLLATWMDATLLVASAGRTTRRQLRDSVALLRRADAPLAGTVLNAASPESGYAVAYAYGSDTGHRSGGEVGGHRRSAVRRREESPKRSARQVQDLTEG